MRGAQGARWEVRGARGARCERCERCEVREVRGARGASLYSMSASRGALKFSLLPSNGDPPQFATSTCCHHTMDQEAAPAAPAAPPESPAPHPVKRRIRKKCLHNKRRSQCAACGGASICPHNTRRFDFVACGGAVLVFCGYCLKPLF